MTQLLQERIQAKPFLKWAGGKGQLIEQMRNYLPKEVIASGKIEKYFEPFVGGGAIFFWLSQEFEIGKAYLYDINPEIIFAYKTIKSRVHELLHVLSKLEDGYLKQNDKGRQIYYYERRDEYNDFIDKQIPNNVVRRSALLIFLNKTCFNGLFRVNSKGLFNVPSGRYTNPKICDEENLLAVRNLLRNAEIEKNDFKRCLEKSDSQSLVYFDPPYRPISQTASFTGYIKNGFSDEDQRRLKTTCDELSKVGAKVILSNSDPKNINPRDNFFDVLYKDYRIARLKATRMINCNSEKRGEIKEILVMNY